MNFICVSKLGRCPFYVILLVSQTLFIQSANGGGNEVGVEFSSILNLNEKMAQLVPHSHKMVKHENEEDAMLKFLRTNLSKTRQFLEPLEIFLKAASKYYKIEYLVEKCKKIVDKLQVHILLNM
jgi:hypothetical protein